MNSNEKINDLNALFPKIKSADKINSKNGKLVFERSPEKSVIATLERNTQNAIEANQPAEKIDPAEFGHTENPEGQLAKIAKINSLMRQPQRVKREDVYVNNYYNQKKTPYSTGDVIKSMDLVENADAELRTKPLEGGSMFIIDREISPKKRAKKINYGKNVYEEFDELQAVFQTERMARMSTVHAFEDDRILDPMYGDFRKDIYNETLRMLNLSNPNNNQGIHLTKIVQEPERRYSRNPKALVDNRDAQVIPPIEPKATSVNTQSANISQATPIKTKLVNDPIVYSEVKSESSFSVPRNVELTNKLEAKHHYREDANTFNTTNPQETNTTDINDLPAGVKVNAGHLNLDDLLKELTNELKSINVKPATRTAPTISLKNQNVQQPNSTGNTIEKSAMNPTLSNVINKPSIFPIKSTTVEEQPARPSLQFNQNSAGNTSAARPDQIAPNHSLGKSGSFGQVNQFSQSNTQQVKPMGQFNQSSNAPQVKPMGQFREMPEQQHRPLTANNHPTGRFNTISAPKAPKIDESNTTVSLKSIRSNNNPSAIMDNYLPKSESVQNSPFTNQPKVDLASAVKKPKISFRSSNPNPSTDEDKNKNPF